MILVATNRIKKYIMTISLPKLNLFYRSKLPWPFKLQWNLIYCKKAIEVTKRIVWSRNQYINIWVCSASYSQGLRATICTERLIQWSSVVVEFQTSLPFRFEGRQFLHITSKFRLPKIALSTTSFTGNHSRYCLLSDNWPLISISQSFHAT